MQTGRFLQSLALALALAGSAIALSAQQPAPAPAATAAAARAFLDEANRELLRLVNASNRAGWTQGTYINVDTEQIAAEANAALVERLDPLCAGGAPLRRRDAAAGRAPPARRAEELADDVGAAGSEGGRGAHAPGRVDGGRVRERQVLPEGRDRRGVPRHRGDHPVSGGQPGPEVAAGGLGRVAHDRRADEEGLRALRRALEQGREGAGVPGHRRDVARQVRHAARRVCEGARPAVGTAAAALSLAARLRAQPAAREVRRRGPREGSAARRTSSATCGSRTGRTSTRSSRPRATRRASR